MTIHIVHAYEAIPARHVVPSLFLAGPTPRSSSVRSWRPAAIETITRAWAGGPLAVLVPEPRDGRWATDYTEQYDWEHTAMEAAARIMFWIPRDMATLPGLTTNIEWGRYCTSGRVVLGAPPTAPDAHRNRYLIHQAARYGVPVAQSLDAAVQAALEPLAWQGLRDIPDPAMVALIGPAGAGKTTFARLWPATSVLELDACRALVSDAGDQDATADAVAVQQLLLEARLSRRRTTILDSTNTRSDIRQDLITRAHRHGLPAIAVALATPLEVCRARNAARPPNRRVPDAALVDQHAAVQQCLNHLADEGFDQVHILRLQDDELLNTHPARP